MLEFQSIRDAVLAVGAFKGILFASKKNMKYMPVLKDIENDTPVVPKNEDVSKSDARDEEEDKSVYKLVIDKKLTIGKGRLASVSLTVSPTVPRSSGTQCSVVCSNDKLEVKNSLVTIDNENKVLVSVKNISSGTVKLTPGSEFGFAKIVPDLELEFSSIGTEAILEKVISTKAFDNSNDPSNIDMYLLSSDDEELQPPEPIKMENRQTDCKMEKVRVTFHDNIDMITSLDEYKRKMNIIDHDSCITGTSTPEILKTSATKEFMTELKETLDKSFDAVGDLLVEEDVENFVGDISIPPLKVLESHNVEEVDLNPVIKLKERPQPKEFKKRESFKENRLSTSAPLLPQLKSLSILLESITPDEDLSDHFPGLIGQDHLIPICETLFKYSMFSQSSMSFELCDFGDKLVCELSSLAIINTNDLLSCITNIHNTHPNACLEEWTTLFSEKFESFQGINDLLGDYFDVKAVQTILLHFVPELNLKNVPTKEPITSLAHLIENISEEFETYAPHLEIDKKEKIELSEHEIHEDEAYSAEEILQKFDMSKHKHNIFVGMKTGEENNVLIVHDDIPVILKLENIVNKSLFTHMEEDLYLIHVSNLVAPKCELAVSLSSWRSKTMGLCRTGFILYQTSSGEYEVAVIDGDKILKVTVSRKQIKMLDDNGSKSILTTGVELKLILNHMNMVHIALVDPDAKIWDLLEVTDLDFEIESFNYSSKNIDMCTTASFETDRKFLVMSARNKKSIYDAQKSIVKNSKIVNKSKKPKRCHELLPANLFASKSELFNLRHVLHFTGTSVKLLNDLIKIEGEDKIKVKKAVQILTFNLTKRLKSRNISSSKKAEFMQFKLGTKVILQGRSKKSFQLHLKEDTGLQHYKTHVHFDFETHSKEISSKITKMSDKCIELHLHNFSNEPKELAADQNVILLEKKAHEKSSSSLQVKPVVSLVKPNWFQLKLEKSVTISAKSVIFVETSVLECEPHLKMKTWKVSRHPGFINSAIFVPAEQMRSVSSSGILKLSLRNRTEEPCLLESGLIVGQLDAKSSI